MTNTILPGETEYCFQLLAVHDEIVEGDEEYVVAIMSTNSSDQVNGSILVIISDNDGGCYTFNYVLSIALFLKSVLVVHNRHIIIIKEKSSVTCMIINVLA